MSTYSRVYLKNKWVTAYKPSQSDYADFFDSFYNIVDDNITQTFTASLSSVLLNGNNTTNIDITSDNAFSTLSLNNDYLFASFNNGVYNGNVNIDEDNVSIFHNMEINIRSDNVLFQNNNIPDSIAYFDSSNYLRPLQLSDGLNISGGILSYTISLNTLLGYGNTSSNNILFSSNYGIDTISGGNLNIGNLNTNTINIGNSSSNINMLDNIKIESNTLTTMNGSISLIKSINIPTDTSITLEYRISSRKISGSGDGNIGDTNSYIRMVSIKNVSDVVTLGTIDSFYTHEDITSFSIYLDVSGTDVLIRVAGVISVVAEWKITTIITK